MQARTKGDNRRSGRTTRMLAAALACALKNDKAFVVVTRGLWDVCKPILKDLGAQNFNEAQRIVSFGPKTKIYFTIYTHGDIQDFELRGIRDEFVFWDHEAIRQKYNHIIKRYHEYD